VVFQILSFGEPPLLLGVPLVLGVLSWGPARDTSVSSVQRQYRGGETCLAGRERDSVRRAGAGFT
jgi:hypothetical protein